MSTRAGKLGIVGHLLGIITGILGFLLFFQGPTTPWSSGPFYSSMILPFAYVLPIWLVVLSIYYLILEGLPSPMIGKLAGIIGLVAAGINFYVGVGLLPLRLPFTGQLDLFLMIWYIGTLLGGVAILLFGIVSLQMYMAKKSERLLGLLMGILFLVIGLFGIAIGIGTGFAAIPLFDYTMIPLMYGIVVVPSILGLIS